MTIWNATKVSKYEPVSYKSFWLFYVCLTVNDVEINKLLREYAAIDKYFGMMDS